MQPHMGRVEVICGSMFCGKTEELIRRVRRVVIARHKIKVFKPSLDDRYGIQNIASHNGQTVAAVPVKISSEILRIANGNTTVVAIDEAQFFDTGIVDVVQELVDICNIRLIFVGLNLDFRDGPFGAMPTLLSIAEDLSNYMQSASSVEKMLVARGVW